MSLPLAPFDADILAAKLISRFGIGLTPMIGSPSGQFGLTERSSEAEHHQPVFIRAADIDEPNGFSIRLEVGWRSIEATFVPDKYAGNMIREMGKAPVAARSSLAMLADSFTAAGNRLSLQINGGVVADWSALPSQLWQRFELSVVRMTGATEAGGPELLNEVEEAATACIALVLSQLPLEDASGEVSAPLFETGLPEGAKTRVEVNRYERNPVNRAACIALYGARCFVCKFDFKDSYGEIGAGYIEVHHVIPVSRMQAGYVVNPKTDLIPLCSNCHSMVHREDPPIPVAELAKRVNT